MSADDLIQELRKAAEWRAANHGPFTAKNLVEWRAADALAELEANHAEYERIIGPMTYREVADALAAKDTALSEMRAENERNRQGFEYHAARAEKERDRANTAEATLATVNHVLEAASDKEKGLYDRIETLVDRATAAEAELERVRKALAPQFTAVLSTPLHHEGK